MVSLPSWDLFALQPASYRESVLLPGVPRLAVEAAASFGWERYADDVVAIDHKPVKGEEDKLMRVQVMRATDAAIFEDQGVIDALNTQRDRIQKAREEAKGIMRLEDQEDEEEL